MLKKHIQAVGRARYTSLTNVLCNVLYVCPAAYVLSAFTGADGIFLSLLVCYTAVLFTHLVYARHISRKNGRHGFDILLFLPDNFELSRDDIWECSVLDQPGCIEASERVYAYCLEKNVDKRRSFHISLFAEEMTKNIVTYGFADGKKHVIVVKLIITENGVLLSIKDNCRRFDPKHYYDSLKTKEDKAKGIGIRMVMPLSKSVSYTNSFSFFTDICGYIGLLRLPFCAYHIIQKQIDEQRRQAQRTLSAICPSISLDKYLAMYDLHNQLYITFVAERGQSL